MFFLAEEVYLFARVGAFFFMNIFELRLLILLAFGVKETFFSIEASFLFLVMVRVSLVVGISIFLLFFLIYFSGNCF